MIVDVPAATPVASPAVLIVATDDVADAQVTWLVRFCVELSENVPVAVNCWVAPAVMLGLAGVTAIDCRVAVAAPAWITAWVETVLLSGVWEPGTAIITVIVKVAALA